MTTPCTIIFTNVTVVDGTGQTEPYPADVGVAGDRIVAIGENLLDNHHADRVVDRPGWVLAPGFIDSHTHDDLYVIEGGCVSKISQGVTTVVTGNCGITLFPDPVHVVPPLNLLGGRFFATFEEWRDEVNSVSPVNVLPLCGHTTLRVKHMHPEGAWMERGASETELQSMERELDRLLSQGVAGLSSGLEYPPAVNAPASEVTRLLSVVQRHGGIYSTHVRNEDNLIVEAVQEALDCIKAAGARAVLSHHKAVGRRNWDKIETTLDMVRECDGVHIDAYPYPSGSTILSHEMAGISERVMISQSDKANVMGRFLSDIAEEWGCSEDEAITRLGTAGAIYFHNNDANVRRVLMEDFCMVGSDGIPFDTHPHPRLWGTFPRFFKIARDSLDMSLSATIHRMTGLPASVYRLRDRGVIKVGAYADLLLFDPATFSDGATYDVPCQPARGVGLVCVNGVQVWPSGDGEGAGRVL